MSRHDNTFRILKNINQKFRILPRTSDYIGLSVLRLIGVKTRVLVQFIILKILYRNKIRTRLKTLHEFYNKTGEVDALVLASGKSVSRLDENWLRNFVNNGGFIYAINQFCDTPLSRIIKPTMLVLSDPAYFEKNHDSSITRLFEYLSMNPEILLAMPAHFDLPEKLPNKTLYFNALSLSGFSRNTSPLKPRGFIGLTAYHALSISHFFPHRRIFFCGIDNDLFKGLERDLHGNLVTIGKHMYYSNSGEYKLYWKKSVKAILQDLAQYFNDLEFFDNTRTWNLDQKSLISRFPIYDFDKKEGF